MYGSENEAYNSFDTIVIYKKNHQIPPLNILLSKIEYVPEQLFSVKGIIKPNYRASISKNNVEIVCIQGSKVYDIKKSNENGMFEFSFAKESDTLSTFIFKKDLFQEQNLSLIPSQVEGILNINIEKIKYLNYRNITSISYSIDPSNTNNRSLTLGFLHSLKLFQKRLLVGGEFDANRVFYTHTFQTLSSFETKIDSTYKKNSLLLSTRFYIFPIGKWGFNIYLGASSSINVYKALAGVHIFQNPNFSIDIIGNYRWTNIEFTNYQFNILGNATPFKSTQLIKTYQLGLSFQYHLKNRKKT